VFLDIIIGELLWLFQKAS